MAAVTLVGREARSPHESVAEARAPTEFIVGLPSRRETCVIAGLWGIKARAREISGTSLFWLQTVNISRHKRLFIYLFFFFSELF